MFNSALKFKKYNLRYVIVILFSFFPYVTPYSFGSDIQPWSFLSVSIFSLVVFYKNIKFKLSLAFLFILSAYSLLLLLIAVDILSAVRSILGYLTMSLVPFVFYYILKTNYNFSVKLLKFTTIIYFLVGVIQLLFNKTFLSFLLNRISGGDSRGVASLTVEPTFYGIICIFLILIFLTLDIKNKYKYIYLLLIQIFLLSQSSMAILFLIIYIFYYFIFKLNIKILFLSFFGFFIIYFFWFFLDLSSYNIRVFQILGQLIENPSNIIIDGSVNERAAAIYFSISGFFDNYMLPNPIGSYSVYQNQELLKQETFLYPTSSNRIASYYGSILFELGVIGIVIPVVYSIIIYKAYRKNIRDVFLYIFFINTILFSAIQLSFPLVGIYMAALLYKENYETSNNS